MCVSIFVKGSTCRLRGWALKDISFLLVGDARRDSTDAVVRTHGGMKDYFLLQGERILVIDGM